MSMVSGQDGSSEDAAAQLVSRLNLDPEFTADRASLRTINEEVEEEQQEQNPSIQHPDSIAGSVEYSHWSDSDTADSEHAENGNSQHAADRVDVERQVTRGSDSDRSVITATRTPEGLEAAGRVIVPVQEVARQELADTELIEPAATAGTSSTSLNVQDTDNNDDTPRRSVRFLLPPEDTRESDLITGRSEAGATSSEDPPECTSDLKGNAPVQCVDADRVPTSSQHSSSRAYDASILAVPGKTRVLPSGPGLNRGIGTFGSRPPVVYSRIPNRIEVERWHWCTHTTIIRKFVAEDNELDKCSICLSHPSQGWLYECTEDRADERWRQGNDFLASWMADAIREGAYDGDEQVGELIRQKLAVRDEAYNQKNPPPPAIHRIAETTSGIHVSEHQKQVPAGSHEDNNDGWIEDISEGSTTILHTAPIKTISEEEHRAIQLGMFDPGYEIDWHIAPCYFKACHTCRPFLEERSYIDIDAVVRGTGPLSSYPHACDFQDRRVDDASCFRKPGDWIRIEKRPATRFDSVSCGQQSQVTCDGNGSFFAQDAESSTSLYAGNQISTQEVSPSDHSDVPFNLQWEQMERRAHRGSSPTYQGQSSTSKTSYAPAAAAAAKQPSWLEAMASRWTQASAHAFRAVRRGNNPSQNLRGAYDLAAVQTDLDDDDGVYQSDHEGKTIAEGEETAHTKMKTISPVMSQRASVSLSGSSGLMISSRARTSACESSMSMFDEDWDEDTPPPVPEHKYLSR